MESEINEICEVKDIEDWITLELNSQDVEDLKQGKTLGFKTRDKNQFIITKL